MTSEGVRKGAGLWPAPFFQMPAAVDRSRLIVVRRDVAFARASGRACFVATGITTSR